MVGWLFRKATPESWGALATTDIRGPEHPAMDDVGTALRAKRKMLGLSARGLSAELGKSPTYISKVESGDINLTLSGFVEITIALGLTNLETLYLLQLEQRRNGRGEQA